jgi:hypothetical protein
VGKSTLCKKMVHDFIFKGMWADIIDRVIWVPLRQLKDRTGPGHTLKGLLCQFFPTTHGDDSIFAEALWESFEGNRAKTLFILDGLDEVSKELSSPESELLIDVLKQPRVIITARPHGIDRQRIKPDLEVETVGFYPDEVKEYIRANAPEKADQIQAFVQSHPVVGGLARIPIQLDALCYSLEAKALRGRNSPTTMTELYKAIENSLWDKDIEQLNRFSKREAQGEDREDIKALVQGEINVLQALAFTGLCSNVVDFDYDYLKRFWERRHDIMNNLPPAIAEPLYRDLDKLSFLRTSDGPLTTDNRSYHFLHLTFQEFFAAQYFVEHWTPSSQDNQNNLSNLRKQLVCFDLTTRKTGHIAPESFLLAEKYTANYNIFWRFVSGLLQIKQNDEALCRFYELIEAEPRDLLGPAHVRLVMHCLAEINPAGYSGSFAHHRKSLEDMMLEWLMFEARICESSGLILSEEPEFPEKLLERATELPVDNVDKMRSRLVDGLCLRPGVSSALFSQAAAWLSSSPSDQLRSSIFRLLQKDPNLSQDTLGKVIEGLEDKDVGVRYSAEAALLAQATLPQDTTLTRALMICLGSTNFSSRVKAISTLNSILDIPSTFHRSFEQFFKNRSLNATQLVARRGLTLTDFATRSEVIREALLANLELYNLGDEDRQLTLVPLKDKNSKTPTYPYKDWWDNSWLNKTVSQQNLQQWASQLRDPNCETQLAAIEEIKRLLDRERPTFNQHFPRELTGILANILGSLLGAENSQVRLDVVEAFDELTDPSSILSILIAHFHNQPQVLLAISRSLYGGSLPATILDGVAGMLGGSKPLARAVASLMMEQHPILPRYVIKTLVNQLDDWEPDIQSSAIHLLAEQLEPEEVFKTLGAKLAAQNPDREPSSFRFPPPPIIMNVAREAIHSRVSNGPSVEFWAQKGLVEHAELGVCSVILGLEEESLLLLHRYWLRNAFRESLDWTIKDGRLCVGTPSAVIPVDFENKDHEEEFMIRLQAVRKKLGVPGFSENAAAG